MLTGTVSKEFMDGEVVIDPETGRVDSLRLVLYCNRLVRQLNYENGERALDECVREYDDGECMGRNVSTEMLDRGCNNTVTIRVPIVL